MSTREVILDGGSPWGFRMHGGADVGQPLRISRVNPGSKAAQKGVREGDVISSINGQSTRSISNSDAHALLRNAGQTLHLGLNEECSGSPKRRVYKNVQESRTESIKRSSSISSSTANGGAGQKTSAANGPLTGDTGRKEVTSQNGSVTKLPSSSTNSTSTPDSKGRRCRPPQTAIPVVESEATPVDATNSQSVGVQETASHFKSLTPNPRTGRQNRQPQQVKSISDPTDAAATVLLDTGNVLGPETEGVVGQSGSARSRRRRRSRANRRKCRSVGNTTAELVSEEAVAFGEDQDTNLLHISDEIPKLANPASVEEGGRSMGEDQVSFKQEEKLTTRNVSQLVATKTTVAEEMNRNDLTRMSLEQENIVSMSGIGSNGIKLVEPCDAIVTDSYDTSIREVKKSSTFIKVTDTPIKIKTFVDSGMRRDERDGVNPTTDENSDIQTEAGISNSKDMDRLGQDLEEEEEEAMYEVQVHFSPRKEISATYQHQCVESVYTNNTNSEGYINSYNEEDSRKIKCDNLTTKRLTTNNEKGTMITARESRILSNIIASVNEESENDKGNITSSIEILLKPQSSQSVTSATHSEAINESSDAHMLREKDIPRRNAVHVDKKATVSTSVSEIVEEIVIVSDLRNQCAYTTLTDLCKVPSLSANETSEVAASHSGVQRRADSLELGMEMECSDREASLQTRLTSRECTALVVDVSDDEVWEETQELVISDYDSSTEEPSQLEDTNVEEKGDAPCILTANTTALHQDVETTEDDMLQSFEDEELLVPIPTMPAEEEASLRLFLQTLNLSAAPEIPQFGRCVSLEDQIVVEDLPLKRGKKRAAPEVYFAPYQQQRSLDVILEETSDHSDNERKTQETCRTEEKNNNVVTDSVSRTRAWEDVVFNPETNEFIAISNDQEKVNAESNGVEPREDESQTNPVINVQTTRFENDSIDGPEAGLDNSVQDEWKYRDVPRSGKQEMLEHNIIMSEAKAVVTISDDNVQCVRRVHEQKSWFKGKLPLWRPSVIISEADDMTGSGDESGGDQRVELAESSDDCVERDASRSHGVEIVYLEDDGSRVTSPPTSSGVSWLRMAQERNNDAQVVHVEDDTTSQRRSGRDVTLNRGVVQERERTVEVVFLEDDSSGSSIVAPQDDGDNDADAEEEPESGDKTPKVASVGKLGCGASRTIASKSRQRTALMESTLRSAEVTIPKEVEKSGVRTTEVHNCVKREVVSTPIVDDNISYQPILAEICITSNSKVENPEGIEIMSIPDAHKSEGRKVDTSSKEKVTSSTAVVEEAPKIYDTQSVKPENNSQLRNTVDGKRLAEDTIARQLFLSTEMPVLKKNEGEENIQSMALQHLLQSNIVHNNVIQDKTISASNEYIRSKSDAASSGNDVDRHKCLDLNENTIPQSVVECGQDKTRQNVTESTERAKATDGTAGFTTPPGVGVPSVGVNEIETRDEKSFIVGMTNEGAAVKTDSMQQKVKYSTEGVTDRSGNASTVHHERTITETNKSVNKTTCHVNFSRGAAFCYIDIPSQVNKSRIERNNERREPRKELDNYGNKVPFENESLEAKSDNDNERKKQNSRFSTHIGNTPLENKTPTIDAHESGVESKNEVDALDKPLGSHGTIQTPAIDKPVGDSNNFEFIKRLLTVMPEQDMSDRTIYSLLSQLTIAQISALSPSLKRNIDALLTVSCRDAQSPCAAQAAPNNIETAVCETDPPASAAEARTEDDASDLDEDDATPPLHSRQGSSSSDATSHNTALYNPSLSRASSEADVSASETYMDANKVDTSLYSEWKRTGTDPDTHKLHEMGRNPKTLKEISVEAVIALPYGVDILRELGLQFIESLNVKKPSKSKPNAPLPPVRKSHLNIRELMKASKFQEHKPTGTDGAISRNLFMGSLPDLTTIDGKSVPASPSASPLPPPLPPPPQCDWMGLQTPDDPRLLLCLSPAQRRSYHSGEEPTPEDAGYLLDLHCKFLGRRGYHEQVPLFAAPPQRPPTPGKHGSLRNSPSVPNYSASSSPRSLASPQPSPPSPSSSLSPCQVSEHKVHLSPRHQRLIQQQKFANDPYVNQKQYQNIKQQSDKDSSRPPSSHQQHFPSQQSLPRVGHASSASPPSAPKSATFTSSDAKIPVASASSAGESETGESSSRLLAILRATSASPTVRSTHSTPGTPAHDMLKFVREHQPRATSWCDGTQEDRLKVHQLSDWMQLARNASRSPSPASKQSNTGDSERRIYKVNAAKTQNKIDREHRNDSLERRYSSPDKAKEQDEKFKLLTEKLSRMARELEEKRDMHSQQIKRRSLPHSLSEKFERQIQLSLQNRPPEHQLDRHSVQTEILESYASFSERESKERRFDADKYVISKKGDIAVFQSDVQPGRPRLQRPKSVCESVATGGELFRQQMYHEYMDRVAERAERRRQKIIRISTLPDDGAQQACESIKSPVRARSVPADGENGNANRAPVYQLECEFMGKVRERMDKLGLKYDDDSDGNADVPTSEVKAAPDVAEAMAPANGIEACYVIEAGGGSAVSDVRQLPKHLQEFLVLTADTEADDRRTRKARGAGTTSTGAGSSLLHEIDQALKAGRGFLLAEGVWTPTQKATSYSEDKPQSQRPEPQQAANKDDDAALPAVWTPHSAGASPTAERKEFRPVNFESPTLARKNRSPAPAVGKSEDSKPPSTPTTPQQSADSPPVQPPWQRDDSAVQAVHSAAASRLVQSQSAPASGLSVLAGGGAIKLPRAQNPTITLLQKAREGQLPRGALYLDHKMSSKESDKPLVGQNEILYTVKKEYQKETEGGQTKKIAELGPRKFEGIGPTTREGIPIVLRSEIKDANQAKWYKRMYDSLHRAGKDDDYVTIRYKPRRGHYPYTSAGGYLSEPEPAGYDSDIGYSAKYATLDRRRIKNKENDFTTSTLPRSKYVPHPASIKYATEVYKNQPGRIEDYEPGHSSISDKEAKQWWDEVLDIFDGWLDSHAPPPNYRSLLAEAIYQRQAATEQQTTPPTPSPSSKPFMTYALKESGYESDSTLVFKRRDENLQSQLSPAEQKLAYKTIQKGGEVPLHGLRKPAPERPKEPVIGPLTPTKGRPLFQRDGATESPHRYVESEVTIHYRSPVRAEAKEALSEEELARRQAEAMRRIYQEERRRKYLQELQDMHSRRHTDNFTPSQKSPIPLNRYDDFLDDIGSKSKSRDRTPEPKLVARALYNFVGQTSRELTFRRGDIIFVRRQIDKNWYEGEHNAMIGLFPFNYVEIIPYDGIRTIPKRPSEGQARAKFNFIAQTHLELSLVKGEMIVLTRRVDGNWFEGRIGSRKGIFPVSYVEVLSEPGDRATTPGTPSAKPVGTPASHSVLVNGSGIKQQNLYQSQTPSSYYNQTKLGTSYTSSNPYATLPRQGQSTKQSLAPVNQTLHIDTHSEPVPYRALYNYRPQNEDELELCEGDTVYVMEKCDDGWYVGSSQRSGYFGTFPGNYVERL